MVRGVAACVVVLAALTCGTAGAATRASWSADAQQATLDAALLDVASDGEFHGEWSLTAGQLREALGALAEAWTLPAVAVPEREAISVATFDDLIVRQLGMGDVAEAVRAEAANAGLNPPWSFGTEVVARMLGLRFNHPPREERLELYPWQPISRAEAAWSLAQAYELDSSQQAKVRATLADFVLPEYSEAQRRALRIAVSKIGMPYVWGGELDHPGWMWGWQSQGGYDCSGLAWRVFKLSGLPAGRRIHGRTAAAQAGEIARSARLRLADVQPGDLVFFGPGRFWQRATEWRITHMGIALSDEFMIHASSQGVYVSSLYEPRRMAQFSWARRIL